MGIWTPFRASTPRWLVLKQNTLRRPFIVALHTSEATGKIYAASVHESAKSRVATKKTVYTSPNYMTRQGKVTVLRELPALLT